MKLKPRIVFDLCMAVILVICMQYGFTGGLWHEIAGTVLIVMFTVHIIMNRKYYGAVIKKMRSGNKQSPGQVLGFVTDVVMLFGAVVMLFSSLVISGNLFTFLNLSFLNYDIWRNVHIVTAVIMLVSGLIHLLLHMKLFRNLITGGAENKAWNICSKVAAVVMSVAVIPISVKASLSVSKGESYVGIKEGNDDEAHEVSVDESRNSDSSLTESIIQSIDSGETEGTFSAEEIIQATEEGSGSETVESVISDTEDSMEEPVQSEISETEESDEVIPTLEEYLGKLFCNGCGKHCSLLNPRCGRGRDNAEKATDEYYAEYVQL